MVSSNGVSAVPFSRLTVAIIQINCPGLRLFPTTVAIARGNTRTLARLISATIITVQRAVCPLAP